MNAIVRTANIDWEITEGKDGLTAYLTGGKYKNLEIMNPANDPNLQKGGRVTFIATNNPENGPYKGDIVGTSPIESISYNVVQTLQSKKQLIPTGTVRVEQKEVNVSMPTYAQMQEIDVSMPTYAEMQQEQQREIDVTVPTYQEMQQEQRTSRNPLRGIVSAVKEKLQAKQPQPTVTPTGPRKNPLSLLAAFAKGALTYEYETTHGETFKLEPISGRKEMLFSGSTFEGQFIVEKPDKFPTAGEYLSIKVSGDEQNGMYAGAPFLSNAVSNVALSDEHGNAYSAKDMGLEVEDDKSQIITLQTKNSIYKLQRIEGRDDIMVLSGGNLEMPYQIRTPQLLLDENGKFTDVALKDLNERNAHIEESNKQNNGNRPLQPISMELRCTDHPINNGFPGINIHPRFASFTEEITRQSTHTRKFGVAVNSTDLDFGSEMQKHIIDMKTHIGDSLGLSQEQDKFLAINITPSMSVNGMSQFNVAIGGLDYCNAEQSGFTVAQQYVQEQLSDVYNVNCSFSSIQPVGQQELNVMTNELSQKALGLDKDSQIQQHAATYVENTPTNPVYVKDEPTTPQSGPQLW